MWEMAVGGIWKEESKEAIDQKKVTHASSFIFKGSFFFSRATAVSGIFSSKDFLQYVFLPEIKSNFFVLTFLSFFKSSASPSLPPKIL